jgi:endonuclease/exonuclease/phosphatase family metal-dependent hydrolase
METVRILTYNLHSGGGMDGVIDYARLANVIRNSNAQISGLQEISKLRPDCNVDDPLKFMAELLSQNDYFAETVMPTYIDKVYHYGIGALSAIQTEQVGELELPNLDNAEPRKAIFLKNVTDSGKTFYFVNTHLAHNDGERFDQLRKEQLQAIHQYVLEKKFYPVIITGDLNDTPNSPCIDYLTQNYTTTDLTMPTFPSIHPEKRIDYIAFFPCDAFKIKESVIIEETLASDHRPLYAELEIMY